jgi:Mor family transcriptional regulator
MSFEVLTFAIGPDATKELCRVMGGADLRVPAQYEGEGYERLALIIGYPAADKLVRYAGGDTLYVPRNEAEALEDRNNRILRMLKEGKKPAEIAREFTYVARLSERHIYRIVQKTRGVAEQLNLFDLFDSR